MRDYEILYIVRPELTEEELGEAVQRVSSLIETLGGSPQRTNVWGRRRLAYEVDHLREGYYVLTDFLLDQERVPELEATLKISDQVFRHQVIRKPRPTPVAAPDEGAQAAGEGAQASAEGAQASAEGAQAGEGGEAAEAPTPAATAVASSAEAGQEDGQTAGDEEKEAEP